MINKQKYNLIRIILISIFVIYSEIFEIDESLALPLYLSAYLIIGYDIIIKAFKGGRNGNFFDENFLMVIATFGAIALSLYEGEGEYLEIVMVMLLYQIGEWFQYFAISKSRKNIASLMDINPESANLYLNDKIELIDPSEININDLLLVKVGEKIPVDGIIVNGSTSVNASALTGESLPLDKQENDEVISGCINLTSPITIKATKTYEQSTVYKILEIIEDSTTNKSQSEQFITRFSRYYTPIICGLALFIALFMPFIEMLFTSKLIFNEWIYRALNFLILSCPCALVISIPLTFCACIGGASRKGILVKGSNYLETLSKAKHIAMDKTGTVTKGIFEVFDVHKNPITKEELLKYAAYSDVFSNHPIAKCIVNEYNKEIDVKQINSIKEFQGLGVEAVINGDKVLVGNAKMMNKYDINYLECVDDVGSIVHVAVNGEYMGHILVNDVIKTNANSMINYLKKLKFKTISILTGDKKKEALDIASKLNLEEIKYELLPNEKVNELEKIKLKLNSKEKIIFVGDGINDVNCLLKADIGIAMGALGADSAIEASDIVLMDDDPLKVVSIIKESKRCMNILWQNIIFALSIKIIILILSLFGISNLMLSILADDGAMIIAVLNSLRLLKTKKLRN